MIYFFFQDLDIGAKHVKIYKNETLVFDGILEKGCGNQVFDYSNTIDLTNGQMKTATPPPLSLQKDERNELGNSSNNNTDEQILSQCALPEASNSESSSKLKEFHFAEDLKTRGPNKSIIYERDGEHGNILCRELDSCSDENRSANELLELPVNSTHLASAESNTSIERSYSPSDPDDLTIKEQLEKLTGRKLSNSASKTPHWLQSSSNLQQKIYDQGSEKPFYILNPSMRNENTIANNQFIDECLRHPSIGSRHLGRNDSKSEPSPVLPRKVCDDLESFGTKIVSDQKRPISGRREILKSKERELESEKSRDLSLPLTSK